MQLVHRLGRRLYELIYFRQIAEQRMQARIGAEWVTKELHDGLRYLSSELVHSIRLEWFEAALYEIFLAELRAGDGIFSVSNPRQTSPTDLYRMALTKAGIDADDLAVKESLPEGRLRIVPDWVKVYSDSVTSRPATLYCRFVSV